MPGPRVRCDYNPPMNHLAHETSPYLLQHAANPVDWYPWGEEALAKARAEDKPILLSIGYSACHWCHVMAHESFEDEATARVMNELFVNVKVDREERPDLDRIYQAAHHLMMRRGGGWPLTMFLAPDGQVPFFAGTYFPKEPRYGMPAFAEVLARVADYYRGRPPELAGQGPALREALAAIEAHGAPERGPLSRSPLDGLRETLGAAFDAEFGGFGDAPKFPQPAGLELLLRCWWHTAGEPDPDVQALYMSALTIRRMGEGGIYDQIGGGFCRYAVDRHWSIPHFEKMLYDNGPLLALSAWLYQVSNDEFFRRLADETADWLLRDMRAPDGGFCASLDADSQGEEGAFYAWTPEVVQALVTAEEYAVLAPRFGLDREPNFEHRWHLRVWQPLEDIAAGLGKPPSTVQRLLDAGRGKLLAARNARVWPGRDEKVLAGWNGLAIRGLAVAARILGRSDLAAAAAAALDVVCTRLVVDGRLHATWKDGRARFNAYLDDHAFLLDATLELLQTRWDSGHLAFATWLADELLARFQDESGGGFFFTSHDHEPLLHRGKPMADEALPAGNGVAALALGRLGHLLGEPRYLDAAEATVRAAWPVLSRHPAAHATLLAALDECLAPPELVVIRARECHLPEWLAVARLVYAPRRLVFGIPDGTARLPGALAARAAGDGPVAWVCRGTQCSAPLHSLEELGAALAAPTAAAL
ncbi:MAG: thioredoxin domain-containing protein [Gammaproteobacteria bacterium]|nr:thioredoxin domain-containing protein [Gammaproteobacteria bacterium]